MKVPKGVEILCIPLEFLRSGKQNMEHWVAHLGLGHSDEVVKGLT